MVKRDIFHRAFWELLWPMDSITDAIFNSSYSAMIRDAREWHDIGDWLFKRTNEQTFRAQMAWHGCRVAYALEYMSYDLPSFCGITEEHAVHFRWQVSDDRVVLLAINHGWFADVYLSERDEIRHCAISFRE